VIAFDAAVRAMDARVIEPEVAPSALLVNTDTRAIEAGQTFLALRGDSFDGHAFVREAVARGAAAVIVEDERAHVPGIAALIVADTRKAYLALAGLARDRFKGLVVAVTGSTGKTTTKHLLAQLLASHFGNRVAATPANENNEIGVSKFLLANATLQHDVLVVEMGARHFGDIAPLVDAAKPEIGVLTNVGEAHVEIMGSRERLAQTKWEVFSRGARAVINTFDETSVQLAPSLLAPPHWFGATDADPLSDGVRSTMLVGRTALVEYYADGLTVRRAVEVNVPGAHNRANLAAAVAAARDAGVDLESVVAAIPGLSLPSGRFERFRLPSGTQIVFDAYNANLSGMLAALDAFAEEKAGRRIAILASMAELGDEAPAMHARVGERVAATNVDVLLAGGAFAQQIATGAQRAGLSSERIVRFATNQEAAQWLRENGRPDDVVLLKGSRVYKLEEVVERLHG
jgi:UDP-N-acetylmuramoyl-tripeptide--D-alanyl-D-alanine ligase